jgi:hypothetical protein
MELQRRGWMTFDAVLANDNVSWVDVGEENIKKILKRLTSDAHTRMRTDPPRGFGQVMYQASKDLSIFAYMGDHIRRDFVKNSTEKTRLPLKVKLNE